MCSLCVGLGDEFDASLRITTETGPAGEEDGTINRDTSKRAPNDGLRSPCHVLSPEWKMEYIQRTARKVDDHANPQPPAITAAIQIVTEWTSQPSKPMPLRNALGDGLLFCASDKSAHDIRSGCTDGSTASRAH